MTVIPYAPDSPFQVVVQIDMLTSLLSIQGFVEGESVTHHQNPYLVHGITAFLYLSMGAAIIALLKETKKKRQEGEE